MSAVSIPVKIIIGDNMTARAALEIDVTTHPTARPDVASVELIPANRLMQMMMSGNFTAAEFLRALADAIEETE